jgi:hypothetical protein
MKAEPESRLERGHDIKFSIDDLAAKTDPEPWDGKWINVSDEFDTNCSRNPCISW